MGHWETKNKPLWRDKGLCLRCGRERSGTTLYCERCLTRGRADDKRRRQRRKENNLLCYRCGRPRDTLLKECSKCAEAGRIRSLRNGPKIRLIYKDTDRCVRCSYPLHTEMDQGYKTCLSCRERKSKPSIRRRG